MDGESIRRKKTYSWCRIDNTSSHGGAGWSLICFSDYSVIKLDYSNICSHVDPGLICSTPQTTEYSPKKTHKTTMPQRLVCCQPANALLTAYRLSPCHTVCTLGWLSLSCRSAAHKYGMDVHMHVLYSTVPYCTCACKCKWRVHADIWDDPPSPVCTFFFYTIFRFLPPFRLVYSFLPSFSNHSDRTTKKKSGTFEPLTHLLSHDRQKKQRTN